MNSTLFELEQQIQHVIDRIAEDRAATAPTPSGSASLVESARRHIGSVLITIGEWVGGPAVRAPRPVSPRPSHSPLLGC